MALVRMNKIKYHEEENFWTVRDENDEGEIILP